MKIFAGLARTFSRLFGRSEEELNRSKLVGMYLQQTNGRDANVDFGQSRQRRNGKYSHNRERA